MTLAPPITPRLDDPKLEEARRVLAAKIVELQGLPFSGAQVITGVQLSDGIDTPVAHKLGRAPVWAGVSCVRNASTVGMVQEVRSTSHDPKQYVVLRADGYGATVTVSLAVL